MLLFVCCMVLLPHYIAPGGVTVPEDCVSDCDFTLTWEPAVQGSTEIHLTGKPEAHDLDAGSNHWIGFGLSAQGRMWDSQIYLCAKTADSYIVSRFFGYTYGYGLDYEYVARSIDDGTVTGSYTDGVLSCSYTLDNTLLPAHRLRLIYGMGPGTRSGGIRKHKRTPYRSSATYLLTESDNAVEG